MRMDDKKQPPRLPAAPPPERRSRPNLLEIDINLEEISAPQLRTKIQNAALERNVIKLFRHLLEKDSRLRAIFTDVLPSVDSEQNVIVSERIVGKIFTENSKSAARIYFEKLGWTGGAVEEKIKMFTNYVSLMAPKFPVCRFFLVDEKGVALVYAKTEEGSVVTQIPMNI